MLKVLDEGERSLLFSGSKVREIPKYEAIYSAEDATDKIYFLLSGMAKVSKRSNTGREAIKSILQGFELFGEQGLSGQEKRCEDVIAMLDGAKVLEIRLETVRELMRKNHSLSQMIIQYMSEKLRSVERRLEAQIFLNAKDRIIEFIRESAIKRGKRVGFDYFLKRTLTQQEIANYTGTSRQTVTEVFNELKKANLIYFNRNKILIREQFDLK